MLLCCVKCTSVLDKATVGDIEVDLCPKCGGLWLDYGEVARLAALPDEDLAPLKALLRGEAGPPPVPSETKVPCPACPGKLKEVVLGTIRVDYCPECKGLFLDKGELEAAIEAVRPKIRAAASHVVAVAAKTAQDSETAQK